MFKHLMLSPLYALALLWVLAIGMIAAAIIRRTIARIITRN